MMKQSKFSCFNGFYCCRYNQQLHHHHSHCWLTIFFFIALIIAQVSPKITTITTTTTTTTPQPSPSAITTAATTPPPPTTTKIAIIKNVPTNEKLQSTSFIEETTKSNDRRITNAAYDAHTSMATTVPMSSSRTPQYALAWPSLTPPTISPPPQPSLPPSTTLAPPIQSSPSLHSSALISLSPSLKSAMYAKYTTHATTPTTATSQKITKHKNGSKVRRVRQLEEAERTEKCRLFEEGDGTKNVFHSPEYPNDYPRNISCTRVITAPEGNVIRLDFRNSFHIEAKEECKFDFLEVRDGKYGYSTSLGRFCGSDFPPEITSTERYLWLHFQSDESIEYTGFTAVYEFMERSKDSPSTEMDCTIDKGGFEGFVNSTEIPKEKRDLAEANKIPLDCLWRIEVQENWKIQMKFLDFKLKKPNDCHANFLDIFPEETVMPKRMKNFCGSAGEGVVSETNVLNIHFFAELEAISSSFGILYTAIREYSGSTKCTVGEFDCDDMTCIAEELKCNKRDNCKFRWDEEKCPEESKEQSEHITIILWVFGLILGGMMITFLVNCMRKLIHDQKIIREHIRQSKESKLDEMDRHSRHSKTRSKENIALDSALRQKHSQTSLEILADLPEHYYPEVVPLPPSHASKESKDKEHSILRHQQHDMTVQTSICDDSSTTTTVDGDNRDFGKAATGNACDMGCQTRESLFVTTPILNKSPIGIVGAIPPPPRLSTFSKEPSIKTIPETPDAAPAVPAPQYYSHLHEQQQLPPMALPSELPPRVYHEPMCHLHHHQHPIMRLPHSSHVYDERQPHHHHHYHTQRQQQPLPPLPTSATSISSQQSKPQMKSEITLPISVPQPAPISEATQLPPVASGRPKLKPRSDQSKEYMDVRNSAPDVIIMTSH